MNKMLLIITIFSFWQNSVFAGVCASEYTNESYIEITYPDSGKYLKLSFQRNGQLVHHTFNNVTVIDEYDSSGSGDGFRYELEGQKRVSLEDGTQRIIKVIYSSSPGFRQGMVLINNKTFAQYECQDGAEG